MNERTGLARRFHHWWRARLQPRIQPLIQPLIRPLIRWLVRPGRWSLRARLLVQMMSLAAVACLVMGAATQVGLRGYLINQIDTGLESSGHRVLVRNFGDGPPEPPPNAPPRMAPPPFVYAAGSQTGTVGLQMVVGRPPQAGLLDERGEAIPIDLNSPVVQTLSDIEPGTGPHTQHLGPLGEYRLIAKWLPTNDGVVVLGVPLKEMNDTLTSAAWIMWSVGLVALALTGLAAEWIVRRSLRPLRRVAATAIKVAELPLERGDVALSERVPDQDTDLRTEVGQVGSALNVMLGRVADALAIRHASETRVRKFVADASHELRTPLAAIRGYAELTRRAGGQVPPDISQALARVESESVRMTALVEDLLLLARLDAGRVVSSRPVDLTQIVVDSVSDARVAGPSHHWRVTLPDDPVIVPGDDSRLRQVVANLLANGRTHTPPGTTVTAQLSISSGSGVALTVTDDGPGIAPELVSEIFERFVRGDTSRSRSAGGTGLGLAIVAAVVAAHHGRVNVQSQPGRTEFTVILPPETTTKSNEVTAIDASNECSPAAT